MFNKLTILFFLYRSKKNGRDETPIYCRITLRGKRKQFACGIFIKETDWIVKHSKVNEHADDSKYINDRIRSIRTGLMKSFALLGKRHEHIGIQQVYEQFSGNTIEIKTLLKTFDYHVGQIGELVGRDYSQATYGKFLVIQKHVSEFLYKEYRMKDISLADLKLGFLQDFEHYLKTIKRHNQNTVNKTIERVKKIVNIAVAHGWLANDPFALFWKKQYIKEVVFLDNNELLLLEGKQLADRLEGVRKFFLFSCYTGLAYHELSTLRRSHLRKDKNGWLWIEMIRKKTKRPISVPIIPKAMQILKSCNYLTSDETIFNPISNQKLNAYLKELAVECAINKHLTHHVARKTFATTVLLNNDIPVDVASFLLGHSKVSTTEEFYTKVQKDRVVAHLSKFI
ncbi:MAG: site-specific integrase [Mucilaginibacter sp.]|nr:site-specific integrase [Mucilaginibacter sp.]